MVYIVFISYNLLPYLILIFHPVWSIFCAMINIPSCMEYILCNDYISLPSSNTVLILSLKEKLKVGIRVCHCLDLIPFFDLFFEINNEMRRAQWVFLFLLFPYIVLYQGVGKIEGCVPGV